MGMETMVSTRQEWEFDCKWGLFGDLNENPVLWIGKETYVQCFELRYRYGISNCNQGIFFWLKIKVSVLKVEHGQGGIDDWNVDLNGFSIIDHALFSKYDLDLWFLNEDRGLPLSFGTKVYGLNVDQRWKIRVFDFESVGTRYRPKHPISEFSGENLTNRDSGVRSGDSVK